MNANTFYVRQNGQDFECKFSQDINLFEVDGIQIAEIKDITGEQVTFNLSDLMIEYGS